MIQGYSQIKIPATDVMHYRWSITASKPDIPLQNAEDVMSECAEKTTSIRIDSR